MAREVQRRLPSGETSAHIAFAMSAGSSSTSTASRASPGRRRRTRRGRRCCRRSAARREALEREDQPPALGGVPRRVADVVEPERGAHRRRDRVRDPRPTRAASGPSGTGRRHAVEVPVAGGVVGQALEVLDRDAAGRPPAAGRRRTRRPHARPARARGRAPPPHMRRRPGITPTAAAHRLADRLGEHEADVLLDDLELLDVLRAARAEEVDEALRRAPRARWRRSEMPTTRSPSSHSSWTWRLVVDQVRRRRRGRARPRRAGWSSTSSASRSPARGRSARPSA